MPNDPARRPRLCIATLDPLNRGGVLALMQFVYHEAAASGFDPYLAYNRVPGVRGESKKTRRGISHESLEGMEGEAVERVLPQFEFLNYITNRKEWRQVLARGQIFFGICGNNLPALPFVFGRKKFSLWVASTIYEERIDRLQQQSLLRKVRDYLSMPILVFLEKKVFMRAERILALSQYTQKKILEKYAIPPEKIVVVPYPIDAEFFVPATVPARANGMQEARPYLLFIGRLEDERKNIPLAIAAFARVQAKHSDLRLKLVGGTLTQAAAALVSELHLERSVDVAHRVSREEMRSLYQGAALFIVPSFQEGLCITALEAMACGTPVVSTRCGGPEEFVHSGQNGTLVPNGDTAAFAEAILALLALPHAERAAMSTAARHTVLASYVKDKVWPRFLECFTMGNE